MQLVWDINLFTLVVTVLVIVVIVIGIMWYGLSHTIVVIVIDILWYGLRHTIGIVIIIVIVILWYELVHTIGVRSRGKLVYTATDWQSRVSLHTVRRNRSKGLVKTFLWDVWTELHAAEHSEKAQRDCSWVILFSCWLTERGGGLRTVRSRSKGSIREKLVDMKHTPKGQTRKQERDNWLGWFLRAKGVRENFSQDC